MRSRGPILRHAVLSVLFVLLYLGLNRPEVILLTRLGVTAWYPATGLVLALLLGISPWYAVLVACADALAGILIYSQSLHSTSETFGAIGVACCYAAAAYVLRGPLKIDFSLRRLPDVARYVLVTILSATAATAIGVACLEADGAISLREYWRAASGWFFGDCIGVLGIAPFLLIHVFPRVRKWLSAETADPDHEGSDRATVFSLTTVAEALAQAVAIVAVLWIMFGPELAPMRLFYLSFVPVIWIAMRNGIRRVVTGVLALNFGMVAAMRLYPPAPEIVARMGLLMLVFSAVGLIVGSAVTERHRIALELQDQTSYLNSLIENSPFGIAVIDRQGRVELTNVAFQQLLMYEQAEVAGRDLDSFLGAVDEAVTNVQVIPQVLGGQPMHTTLRRRRKDGKILHLELDAVPLFAKGRVRGAYMIYKDVADQVNAAEVERRNAESLRRVVAELKLRTKQMSLLSEMGDLLECCATTKEASAVVGQSVQKLFPDATGGTFYLFRSSRNLVEAAARWGDYGHAEPLFAPNTCWALRRGKPHWSGGEREAGIGCSHGSPAQGTRSLCVPILGQEGALGVLQLIHASSHGDDAHFRAEDFRETLENLAVTVAGQIGFSLTSLRLRETLRDQSIRDPLTGLFNRRFMEESLARELQRAARKRHSVSVLFLDLDHFKHFNDTFGHDAGDVVLRSIADLFRRFFRADDICCRFGGEEFAIILPESASEYAAIRAEKLCAEVKQLKIRYKGGLLEKVTLSVGVAAYPEHAATPQELLTVADRCLYDSKSAGRDRVTLASQQPA